MAVVMLNYCSDYYLAKFHKVNIDAIITAKKHIFACMHFSSTHDAHFLHNVYNICAM